MSLSHIQGRRQPLTFGADLSVLIADTYINGDLDIQGNINGTSSQGQNTDNTWSGTNEYSVNRPSCPVDSVGLQDGVNKTFLDEFITDSGIVRQGATWAGTNDFNLPFELNTYIPPVNATDAVAGKYIQDSWNAKNANYLTSNNTWTNTNTFSVLPLVIEPTSDTMIATKNYTDTTITNISAGADLTTTSQFSLANADWGATALAASVQIIGGGGGSTSAVGNCVCSGSGVSGGSGSQASIIILTNMIGLASSYGLGYSITTGGGGGAGTGCGTQSASGGGNPSYLYITPSQAKGLNPAQYNLLKANAGGGFGGTCGQPGNSAGGTYSNINPLVVSPFASSNGRGGSQCAGNIYQPYGINNYGWGARGASCANGSAGAAGGYGLTLFLG
jgi:hypothetical protein